MINSTIRDSLKGTLLTLFLIFITTLFVQSQDYELVWEDNFDGTEVDLSKWSFQLGDGSEVGLPPGWGNNELQYYQSDNATVSDGFLTITAREETVEGFDYTSTRMRSLGKGDWTYGRFEARAKMPIGKGMWPAIWMLSSDPAIWEPAPSTTEPIYGTWAASGEIDIMEYLGDKPREIFGTIHYGAPFPGNTFTSEEYILPDGAPDFSEEFHTYAIEWEYGEIRWYIDDILYATQNDWFSTGGPYPAPFDVDFHLILNLAVGGNLPGNPDASTIFPQELVIDYVRVLQKPNNPPSISITNPADGSNLTPGTNLTIQADVTDDLGIALVEFYQGEAKIGEDDTAPYELTLNSLSEGCYSISAEARDMGGLKTLSAPVDFSVGTGCPQSSYLLNPTIVPGIIQAENFDNGGQGVSYNDSDNDNIPGDYRSSEGVDTEKTFDGEFDYKIVNISPGEWVEYSIDVASEGNYDIDLRLSANGSGSVNILFDEVDKSGNVPFGTTGGFNNWTNVRVPEVSLSAGAQIMRINFNSNTINLNSISIEESADPGAPVEIVFDDMEHGNPFGNGWFAFGGSVGGGGIGSNGDVPPENGGNFSIETGWGSGGTPGFYGGFGRTSPVDLSGVTHFNFWINPFIADQAYTIEMNFQEDDNNDNSIDNPNDDEFQYNIMVGPEGSSDVIAGGGWQLVSIPVEDLFDDNSFLFGGSGEFDPVSEVNGGNGQLINIVWAIIGSGTDANFRTDYWSFTGPPTPEPLIYDDMEHGNPSGNGWFSFGGAVGGGGIDANSTDLPPGGGNFSLQTGWGSGGNPGFFGGFGRTNRVDLSNLTYFNFWINPDPGQDYTIEVNLQDDDNGNNLIPFPPTGEDDEFQFNVTVGGPGAMVESGGGWQLVSLPLADFFDDNGFLFGGNGVLDAVSEANGGNGQLINVIMAIVSNSGADVTFRTDNWSFTSGPAIPPITEAVWDDFEDGDASDWGFFGGNAAGGGGGVADDRPQEGDFYFSTGWGGGGSNSIFYGGFFKNVPDSEQIELPEDPWFNVWVLNQSNATSDSYVLEFTIREDTDGNGYTNGVDDSFRFDQSFSNFDYNDNWVLISAPLSSFTNLGTGLDGSFTGKLDEVVVVVSGVSGSDGSNVEVDFDQFIFTSGGPLLDDTTAPEITFCPEFNEVIPLDEGRCGAIVYWTEPTAIDDISLFTVTQTEGPENGSEFAAGSLTTISYEFTDAAGNTSLCSFDISVAENQVPEITQLNGPAEAVLVNSEVGVTASYDDENIVSASIDWGDGFVSEGVIDENQTISGMHSYTGAGIYQVNLTIEDICGETSSKSIDEVVIYDPEAGFVTGAGFFNSPKGAYIPDDTKSGRFIFGFNARYNRNKGLPKGNTSFYFRAGRFLFWSTDYDWVVVEEGTAVFQGRGTALRNGEFDFRMEVVDGNKTGSYDAVKITIWNESGVVYDNDLTEISAGNIKVKNFNKNNQRTSDEQIDMDMQVPEIQELIALYSEIEFEVYPNPFRESLHVFYVSELAGPTTAKILDVNGEEVAVIFDGITEELTAYDWEYQPGDQLSKGIYLLHIQEGSKSRVERLIYLK